MLNDTEKSGFFVPETNLNNLYGLVIPHSGHTLFDAIKDLVDNSFDAGASKITIDIKGEPSDIQSYWIYDNGSGMDYETLKGAMTYSAGSSHKSGDLGKFSIGCTTACCTIGLIRRIFTKTAEGDLLVASQDFSNVSETSFIKKASNKQKKFFKDIVGNHGTIIEISSLREDKREYKRIRDLKSALIKDLGASFYLLLSNRRKIFVSTPKEVIEVHPKDPLFYKTDPQVVDIHKTATIDFDGSKIDIRMVHLNLDAIDSSLKRYDDQGVYFCRNNRLISSGRGVKNLWVKNPRKNAGRIEISFTEELDAHFGLTATKNKVSLSQSLTDTLAKTIKTFVIALEEKWKKNEDTTTTEIEKEIDDFKKQLIRNAGIIHLPKDVQAKEKRNRSKEVKKPGSVSPKNTGKKRSASNAYKVPEFKFQQRPRVTQAFWIDFGDNDEMYITMNLSNSFVREHWTNGTEASRRLMRKWTTATCLAFFRKKETYHENAAKSFMVDLFEEIKRLQIAFGK